MFAPVTEHEVIEFLETRRGKLDGVVITGGEPTLQPDLLDFMARLKAMGFAIKLDTNGSRPSVMAEALRRNLVDYLAMDIKAPWRKYQTHINSTVDAADVRLSAALAMNSGLDYEFRTTVVKEQLTPEDILEIVRSIAGARRYILQRFLPTKTLDPAFMDMTTYSDEEFEKICEQIRPLVAECSWR